jgi:hypothetical protein
MASGNGDLRQQLIDSSLALPPPDTLDVAGLWSLARCVSCELRPVLLDRLVDTLSENPAGSPLERWLADALIALDAYDGVLDQRLVEAKQIVSMDRTPMAWSDVTIRPGVFASGKSPLFTCQLSRAFVHGPITLLHALDLTERLIAENEVVNIVRYATWTAFARWGMQFEVTPAVGPIEQLRAVAKARGLSLIGRVGTTSGREFDFTGMASPEIQITARAAMNDWTLCLMNRVERAADECVRMPLRPARADMPRPSGPIVAATLLDILLAVTATSFELPGKAFLLSVADLRIPAEFVDCLRNGVECIVQPSRDRRREVRPGLFVTPVDYAFPPIHEDFAQCVVVTTEGHYASLLPQSTSRVKPTRGGQ